MSNTYLRIAWLNSLLISIILVAMPFHAFGVTTLSYWLGHKELISSWKEVLIGVLVITSLLYWYKNRHKLKLDSINITAGLIIVLSIAISLLNHDWHKAFLVGVKANLVALVLFFAAQLVADKFSNKKLRLLILIPAGVVVVLAFLQPYLFHTNFLLSIGYGPEGSSGAILAGQYIESAASTVRSFSTLGGPNQLGAYLIIPALISLAYYAIQRKWLYLVLSAVFAAGVYVSYSRSALIGLVCGALVIAALQLPKKLRLGAIAALGVIIISFLFLLLWPNQCQIVSHLPKSLIHGSCNSGQLSGSDKQRVESQHAGLVAIRTHPFGLGLGAAGPSSFSAQHPLITENWYLQIAIETGLIGLLLYFVFFVLLGKQYYMAAINKGEKAIWPVAGIAIIIAVGVASMFLHSWADSTLVLVGFGLFGIIKGKIS